RDRERKLDFKIPDNLAHPHLRSIPQPQVSPTDSTIFQGLMKIAPTWEDIVWIKHNTALPVILKGVLHPQDAKKAIDIGVDGLIISNHGGRILDTTISPLHALQMIRKITPTKDYPLLVDGGIRRGTDVFKAIALGANAVLIGRPYIYGLSVAGALGVAHVIRTLREEFEVTMALMGTATLQDINKRKLDFKIPDNLAHPHLRSIPQPQVSPTDSTIFQGLMKIAPTWEDIVWIKHNTALPVILKGVLHPQDAKKAIDIGVDGLIISNHGGRILDTTISPLHALQMIRKITPTKDYPLLVDGGIRRGTDVFKAIALGANAVLIGRPYIYGLSVAGALGVAHVIRTLREEFEVTMALMGTATLQDINSDYIFQK
ncbi:hypothetical protein GWI33_010957, partial [Rhynchophorus ferrugineus]